MITLRAARAHRARTRHRQTRLGIAAFWLMVGGMFGMTMALAVAGITQTYLERILGIGYPRDAAEDPGALPDVARHRGCSSRSGVGCFVVGLRPRGPAARREAAAPPRGLSDGRREPDATEAAAQRSRCRRTRSSALEPRGRSPYYRPIGDEVRDLRGGRAPPAAGAAQGPDRLRQDALRAAHGVAARPPARHRRLSRRPLGQRSARAASSCSGGDTVWQDGPLTRGRARRRDRLPRRGGRGAPGHGRRAAPAHRRPPPAAARARRRAARGAPGLPARGLATTRATRASPRS